MQSLWILLLFTMVLIIPGQTLKCYQCLNCNSTAIEKMEPKQCPASSLSTACYKLTFKVNGQSFTNRDCVNYLGNFDQICDIVTESLKNAECNICDNDGCNGGSRLFALSLSSLVLSLIFVKISF